MPDGTARMLRAADGDTPSLPKRIGMTGWEGAHVARRRGAADGDTPSLPKKDRYDRLGGRACCAPLGRRGRRHAVPPKEGLRAGRNQAGWAAAYQVFAFSGMQGLARFAVKIRVVA